jgi:hypothetical protein
MHIMMGEGRLYLAETIKLPRVVCRKDGFRFAFRGELVGILKHVGKRDGFTAEEQGKASVLQLLNLPLPNCHVTTRKMLISRHIAFWMCVFKDSRALLGAICHC